MIQRLNSNDDVACVSNPPSEEKYSNIMLNFRLLKNKQTPYHMKLDQLTAATFLGINLRNFSTLKTYMFEYFIRFLNKK